MTLDKDTTKNTPIAAQSHTKYQDHYAFLPFNFFRIKRTHSRLS